MYRITLKRSPLKLPSTKLGSVKALGLKKTTGSVSFMPVNAITAGKILSVKELLKVELVEAGAKEQEKLAKQRRRDTDKGWHKIPSAPPADA